MGLVQKFVSNARKPDGLLGKLMVTGMNVVHAALAECGCGFLGEEAPSSILDIGCGGGANIKRFLKSIPGACVTGLDYSSVSVEMARKLNAEAIAEGRCEIIQGDVSRVHLPTDKFDLATAFETVYFWPEIQRSVQNVFHNIVPGGRFLIVNESTGVDPSAVRYAKIIDGMNLYTPERLTDILTATGFCKIEVHQAENAPWIAVLARKAGREEE